MSRCGCDLSADACNCAATAGTNADVSGSGAGGDPITISGAPLIRASLAAIQADGGIQVDGTLAWAAATERVYQYDGAVWILVWCLTQPRVFVHKSGVQAIPTGVSTEVTFAVEDEDTDAFHAGGNAQLTVPSGLAGLYDLWANVVFDNVEAIGTEELVATIRVNGVLAVTESRANVGTVSANRISVGRPAVALVAGDDVTLTVQHTRGSDWSVLHEVSGVVMTRFGMVWRGAK